MFVLLLMKFNELKKLNQLVFTAYFPVATYDNIRGKNLYKNYFKKLIFKLKEEWATQPVYLH